ncbi:MAG: type II toxin-antitoxin system prevent-host-death family antitoxin [Candidatus Sericytochromatia bacterium]|nr:type II toxin-antitoxin system prevent-host-death family antitoxin [Candidatus Tanganyikabacteria bacterium]
MKFVAAREFRIRPGEIWQLLEREGQVVVTSNGKPIAILTGVSADDLEDTLRALRQTRAEVALGKIRKAAQASGADRLGDEAIEAEIRSARRART